MTADILEDLTCKEAIEFIEMRLQQKISKYERKKLSEALEYNMSEAHERIRKKV